MVLYTDGVTEAINRREQDFGEARLAAVLREAHALPAPEIISAIISAVMAFTDDAPQFDDFALVVLKRELQMPSED
jgi:sigma-B regulation protein RsbU (phosphoserine phosphatase)